MSERLDFRQVQGHCTRSAMEARSRSCARRIYHLFRKGLEWFASAQCPMCLNDGGAPCENRKCASAKELKSCLLCDDYLACKHTQYQRDWYPFVIDNYNRVKQVGFQKHLEEEEERARAGIDLMGHLERRCCKVVKLEEE